VTYVVGGLCGEFLDVGGAGDVDEMYGSSAVHNMDCAGPDSD